MTNTVFFFKSRILAGTKLARLLALAFLAIALSAIPLAPHARASSFPNLIGGKAFFIYIFANPKNLSPQSPHDYNFADLRKSGTMLWIWYQNAPNQPRTNPSVANGVAYARYLGNNRVDVLFDPPNSRHNRNAVVRNIPLIYTKSCEAITGSDCPAGWNHSAG